MKLCIFNQKSTEMDTFNINWFITPSFDFPKTWKSGFCTCHLQERLTLWCVIVMVQKVRQMIAKELRLTPR